MDRALSDRVWLRERLADVEAGKPDRAAAWARLALQRANLHLRWAVTGDRAEAVDLEKAVLKALSSTAL